MKVELLPSTVGEAVNRQFCIGAVIDESIAIDAGTLGMVWPLERQQKIDHVLLSHSHMDHIATLPLLLDNVYQKREHCPVIHGSEATIVALRQHIFNNSIWPDFVRLSEEETPFLELRAMNDEEELRCGNLTITPVSLNHIVPTSGFVVRHPEAAVAFISDLGTAFFRLEPAGRFFGMQLSEFTSGTGRQVGPSLSGAVCRGTRQIRAGRRSNHRLSSETEPLRHDCW
jgi:ribonuclease BN (tRNA processing enzyme)